MTTDNIPVEAIRAGVEAIRIDLVRRDGLAAFANSLDAALSLLGQTDALQGMADQAATDRDTALSAKAEAEAGVLAATEQAASILATAQEQADGIAEQARADAQAVADKAAQDAKQAVADALAGAQKDLTCTRDQRDAISLEITTLNGNKAEAQASLDTVSAELAEKQSALAAVKAAIAALRG